MLAADKDRCICRENLEKINKKKVDKRKAD